MIIVIITIVVIRVAVPAIVVIAVLRPRIGTTVIIDLWTDYRQRREQKQTGSASVSVYTD